MPRKLFNLTNKPTETLPLNLPPKLSVLEALERVFKIVSVGSKRYLTNKVSLNVVYIKTTAFHTMCSFQ